MQLLVWLSCCFLFFHTPQKNMAVVLALTVNPSATKPWGPLTGSFQGLSSSGDLAICITERTKIRLADLHNNPQMLVDPSLLNSPRLLHCNPVTVSSTTSVIKETLTLICVVEVAAEGSLIGKWSICLFVPVTGSRCSLIIQQGSW